MDQGQSPHLSKVEQEILQRLASGSSFKQIADEVRLPVATVRAHVNRIVDVVRKGTAPEVSVPRWLGPGQAVRVLAPPVYRAGLRRAVKGGLTKPTD